MQTQKITLDFCQNDYKTVTVKQYDKDSRNLIVTCTDNGNIYKLDPTTQQCNIKMITPDNRPLYKPATINEDGTILVVFDEDMVHVGGTGKLEFQVIDASTKKTISTMILTVIIVSSVYPDDAVIASEEFSALTDAMLNISESVESADRAVKESNEAIERIEQLESNIEAAESIRVTNENNREEAESNRETGTATAITNANVATQNANEATQDALDAISATNTATSNANTATQNANTVIAQMESLIKNDNLIHKTDLGVAGGVATLDSNGNIPSSQLPAFVDDVLEGSYDEENDQFLDLEGNPYSPESGKIYVDTGDRATYRWSGTTFVAIGTSMTLGTTSSTAYPGDRGLDVENRVIAIENYHNNIPASDIKFDNSVTSILGANVQSALEDLTVTASSTRDGLMSSSDKKIFDNYKNIITIETTLLSAKWVGSSAPYTQILSVEGLNNYNNCNIVVRDDITVEQENALINADITSISYDESIGLTFIASGVKPPIDIPILLKVGASMNVVEVPNYLSEIDVASNIFYDNTSSGTVASNVQSAIDEINTNLANRAFLESDISKYSTVLEWALANPNTFSKHMTMSNPFSDGADVAYGKYWCVGDDLNATGLTVFSQPNNSSIIYVRTIGAGQWMDEWDTSATKNDLLAKYLLGSEPIADADAAEVGTLLHIDMHSANGIGTNAYLITIGGTSGQKSQFAIGINENVIRTRTFNTASWSNWQKVILSSEFDLLQGCVTASGLDVINYFTHEAVTGVTVLRVDNPVNAAITVQSWFTFYKVSNYGRIEQRPINGENIYVRYMANGAWSSGWVEYARTSHLANYLPLTGGALTGDLCAKRFVYGEGQGTGTGLGSTSYASAPFLSEAQYRLNNGVRAGYGFHNAGVNASFLYLDIASNRYMCIDNTGHVDKIMTSANFGVSGTTLTINLD